MTALRLSPDMEQALAYVKEHPGATSAEIGKAFGWPSGKTHQVQGVLFVKKLVRRKSAMGLAGLFWSWWAEEEDAAEKPAAPISNL